MLTALVVAAVATAAATAGVFAKVLAAVVAAGEALGKGCRRQRCVTASLYLCAVDIGGDHNEQLFHSATTQPHLTSPPHTTPSPRLTTLSHRPHPALGMLEITR